MRALLVFMGIFVPSMCFAIGETDSYQCSSGIVSIGDSQHEVVQKCGNPARKGHVYKSIVRYGKARNRSVEEWTYNPGPNGFVYLVSFEGGKVVDIYNTGSYGK